MSDKKRDVPWSPEDDARLEEMWGKGVTAPAIAAVLKRTTGATEARIVVLRRRGVPLAGRADVENRKKHPQEDVVLDAWLNGDSASVIAARTSLSRSAVLGLVKRARDGKDPRAIARDRKPKNQSPRKRKPANKPGPWEQTAKAPKPPKAEPVPKTPPPPQEPSLNLTLAELQPGQCKFVTTAHDVPADAHRFCGQPTRMGRPYCTHHCSVAYNGLRAGRSNEDMQPTPERLKWARENQQYAAARQILRKFVYAPAAEHGEAVDA